MLLVLRATDPSKIQAVAQWPEPKDSRQLRGFLGLAGYYRKFIKGYGLISRPLTDLLKKNMQYHWTPQLQTCFQNLKQALVSAPVLALPDFTRGFVVETDACDQGIGAVLMQQGHPIAYLSKALSKKSQTLSTYEKECLAVILAVDKWKPYLQHQPFTIHTDHKSLVHLGEQKLTDGLQHKAFVKLLGLQYKVVYKKGLDNTAADALSRKPSHEEVYSLSTSKPRWLEIIVEGYQQHDDTKQLLAELSLSGSNAKGFSLVDGLIRYKGRIWLGSHSEAHRAVFNVLHDSGLGGHCGIAGTYNKIKSLFAWPSLKKDVKQYVSQCQVCQKAKPEHSKAAGFLQPLPIPDQAWQIISMDFIEGLPKSKRFDTILVVVDKLTKYGHFIPLAHPYTALSVAQLFHDNVYKLHGLPKVIISDRNRVFTSALCQHMFSLAQTTLNMSSSYHPQTERLNQCLETYLRCMVHDCPTKWSSWISLAEFWYNTTVHSSHGKTPFEVLYGHPPRHFGISADTGCPVEDLDKWLKDRAIMQSLIKHNLSRAQQRMKSQADKNRQERQFEVGDWVYLKLQPFAQTSVANRINHKLSYKFFGPYLITQKVGPVAYRLQLPAASKIHPVIHVSQLKKDISPSTVVSPDDLNLIHVVDKVVPTQVTDVKLQKQGNKLVPLGRVQWSSLPST